MGDGAIIEVDAPLHRIPIFVKDGGIVPLARPVQNTRELEENLGLEIRHYGQAAGVTRFYWDDGVTFNYESGDYAWFELSATPKADGTWRTQIERADGDYASPLGDAAWRQMTDAGR